MSGSSDGTSFDNEARQLIRNALLQYMRAHRVGVVRLAKRIQAAQPLKQTIPIKTLQRFLAGSIRTTDPYVAMFHRFAERLTESDPISKLGERLSIFYSGGNNSHDYSGTYMASTEFLNPDIVETEIGGNSEIVIAADAEFWRVTEKTARGHNNSIYDGVLVCSGNAAVVVLKDRLTGLARNYILSSGKDMLHGHGAEARFLPGNTTQFWDENKISGVEPIEIQLGKIIAK